MDSTPKLSWLVVIIKSILVLIAMPFLIIIGVESLISKWYGQANTNIWQWTFLVTLFLLLSAYIGALLMNWIWQSSPMSAPDKPLVMPLTFSVSLALIIVFLGCAYITR